MAIGLGVPAAVGGVGPPEQRRTSGQEGAIAFPVTPVLWTDQFQGAEGITFTAEGRLFVGANRAVWELQPDASARRVVAVDVPLGQAGIGARDMLAADFGPRNVFNHGANDDGVVWRITPEGEKTVFARGIADPNGLLVLADGSVLVSDDGTDRIYRVATGTVSVWSTAVPYPNGLALSPDDGTLYVAQIFSGLNPTVFTDKLWAMPVLAVAASPRAAVVARTGEGGLDGLAVDHVGRVYIADNGAGKIWRFDPRSSQTQLIAAGMPAIASLVFGEGSFDRESLYVTSTARGGGRLWRVPVGARGARLHR